MPVARLMAQQRDFHDVTLLTFPNVAPSEKESYGSEDDPKDHWRLPAIPALREQMRAAGGTEAAEAPGSRPPLRPLPLRDDPLNS